MSGGGATRPWKPDRLERAVPEASREVRGPHRGNLSIAVLCNAANANPRAYARRLADRLLGLPPEPAQAEAATDGTGAQRPASAGDAARTLTRYLGVYRDERTNTIREIAPETIARWHALPDGWALAPDGTRLRLEPARDGRPARLVAVEPDGDTTRSARIADRPWTPARDELAPYAGRYRSDELGVTFELRVTGDTLTLTADTRPGTTVPLEPRAPDHFVSRGTTIRFTRDGAGRVAAMHLSQARVWDLVADRVP